MQCAACGHANPSELAFCVRCAAPLAAPRCPRCGFENPMGGTFCGRCAAPLAAEHVAFGAAGADSGAERRHLTVMFADLVDSTGLSQRLDPEDLLDLVSGYRAACAEVIDRRGGYVAQYQGDGVLAYFGYPRAHEDDPVRATDAGLEIVGAVRALGGPLAAERGVGLGVRIGIHTGLVVVGDLAGPRAENGTGRREGSEARHGRDGVVGETPNVAARLQGVAGPNEVVLSGATHRLVRGLFACETLGPRPLKGISEPVAVYRVVGRTAARGRLDVAESTGLTPLVDREEELALLRERWEAARGGRGRVVLITGEPGIGKSRLVRVLRDELATTSHVWLESACSPDYRESPLRPTIDMLGDALAFDGADDPAARRAKLEAALEAAGLPVAEALPLLATLLSLPLPPDIVLPPASPARQQQRTRELLVAWIDALAAARPVVLVVDDLHWIDPSTLELLSLLVDREPTTRLLIVLTARPEFRPPWPMHAHVSHVTLSRLDRGQVAELAAGVAGGRTLPAELLRQIATSTDGVPLFVEEVTKMLLESDLVREGRSGYETLGRLAEVAVPATLHDSLMARLDRLGTAKGVAQIAATLGRAFSYGLLAAVAPLPPPELRQALGQLVGAELLAERGVPPHATYAFKHALIQETAYQSLLKSARQHYHALVGEALVARFPETAAAHPEVVARHFTLAARRPEAVNSWYLAGQRAVERGTNEEAVAYLSRGLELLGAAADAGAQAPLELALQTLLGVALMARKGYGAPEVEAAFARAHALCRETGDAPPFPVLRGLWAFSIVRGRLREARALAERLLAIATAAGEPGLLLEAHYALGGTLFYLGEHAAAIEHSERGIALYDPERHRIHTALYGADPGMTCCCYAAGSLWYLGHADRAVARIRDARAIAEATAHPVNVAFALCFGAVVHQVRGDAAETRAWAESGVALADEQALPFWSATGRVHHGWSLMDEDPDAGRAEIEGGLGANRAAGAEVVMPMQGAMLAEARLRQGDGRGALALLAECLDAAARTDVRYYEAELHRLRAEALLLEPGGGETEAERELEEALAVARRQEARALELRAATSLARHLARRGRRVEARAALAPVLAWFREGLDTADLVAASALLATLG
jgi:class 3 adenylate cyclase/predicted ATPase